MKSTTYISAYYEDDGELLAALKQMKKLGMNIADVFTPFPVHGIDKVLGYRRSYIARVGFIGGAIGAVSGFIFQTWVFTDAYTINYGGKPLFAVPSFIPVTFECTILFAAIAMVFAFLFRSKLGLGADNIIYDEKITDDRFLILMQVDHANEKDSIREISQQLKELNAKGIKVNRQQE